MEDFGQAETPLYEFSDAKTELEMRRGPTGWKKKCFSAYLIFVMIAFFAWLLYSLIAMSLARGFGKALVSHIGTLFVFIAGELILFLTVTGKWGAFARSSIRSRTANMRDPRVRMLAAEIAAVDANKPQENALRIFADRIVVINGGTKAVLPRADIGKIVCTRTAAGLRLSFRLLGADAQALTAAIAVPVSDFPMLRKYLGGMELKRDADLSAPTRSLKKRLLLLLPFTIFLAAGIVLFALHFTAAAIPWPIGVLFLLIPMIGIPAVFSDYTFVRNGFLPLMTGLVFVLLPVLVAAAVLTLTQTTAAELLGVFTPVHMVLGVFFAIGIICIFSGAAGMIDGARWHLD